MASSLGCNNKKDNSNLNSSITPLVDTVPNNYISLKNRILIADSVIVIGHEVPEEYAIHLLSDSDEHDSIKEIIKQNIINSSNQKYLVGNKVNRKIIKEYSTLNRSFRERLATILIREADNRGKYSCDDPRHSILIYKDGIESFLLLCFTCHKVHTSNDISFKELDMDSKKWADLEVLFKELGLVKMFNRFPSPK